MNTNKSDAYLLAGNFISYLGSGFSILAGAYLTYQYTNSFYYLGAFFILQNLPQVLVSIIFGTLANKINKIAVCIFCDILRCLCILIIPASYYLELHSVEIVFISNFLIGLLDAAFRPSVNSIIHSEIAKERIENFSRDYEISTQAGVFLSSAIGGYAVTRIGVYPIFIFGGATYLISAYCFFKLIKKQNSIKCQEEKNTLMVLPARNSNLISIICLGGIYSLGSVFVTVSNTLLVALLIGVRKSSTDQLGIIDAMACAGVMISALIFSKINKLSNVFLMVCGYIGCLLMVSLQPYGGFLGLFVFYTLAAICFGIYRISSRAILIKSVSTDNAGFIFGFSNALAILLSTATTFFISFIATTKTIETSFSIFSLILFVLFVLFFIPYYSFLKENNAYEK
jgi:MFS transporter, DHA3 family, macrolide efflux protein